MRRKSSTSRRKVLGSIAASGVAISTAGIATAAEDAPDIEVKEETGIKAKREIIEAMNKEEWKSIEDKLANGINIQPKIQSATATKVKEENGEERYVVSVPYNSEIKGDVEIFIQSSGIHQLNEIPGYWEETYPNIMGYDTRVEKEPSGEIEDDSESERSVLKSNTYYSENGSTVSNSSEVELSTEFRTANMGAQASEFGDVWYPVPPSGECDNCKTETGVDCAPSRECLGRMASIVGAGIGCAACAYAPSWYNPACWACLLSGFAQALLGSLDCLGCDEVIEVCITDEFADDYCEHKDDPDPPECLPGEPCPVQIE